MKIKITATFRVSERLHFEVIKRFMSPEKFFGTFEKRAPGDKEQGYIIKEQEQG